MRQHTLNVPHLFCAMAGESPVDVKARVEKLFEDVKERLKEDEVFSQADCITLEPKSVAWVIGQLELGSLTKTDTDVVGDAFEVFAEPKMAGEKGEFFTPGGVIKVAAKLTNPKPEETVCDPACGSGGFLIYAMKYVWEQMERHAKWRGSSGIEQARRQIAGKCFFGIDKESDLVKIAKAYMAISGDGRSKIVHENALHPAFEFSGFSKTHFVSDNDTFQKFDFVMSNPPYGRKAKVLVEDSRHFELGHKHSKAGERSEIPVERDPYVLFIERCLGMLKDGGLVAIVLPETVFHAPSVQYLRQFIFRTSSVAAIVDLPRNTFRPHCWAKTCLLVLKKGAEQEDEIIMSAPKEMGHDHQGKELFRLEDLDDEHLKGSQWDDL